MAPKTNQVSSEVSSGILRSLVSANEGAGMVVRQIERLLKREKVFPRYYASLLIDQVNICGAQTKRSEFARLCSLVVAKLKKQT